MSLPASYLLTTKNLEKFFNSLMTAKAPEIFTQKFLESLELKSTNDRLYIGLLKTLGFVDTGGVPTDRYYKFLDQSQSKIILADAIKEAYSDLFNIYTQANTLSINEIKNKLKTLTQGKYSEIVINCMANTFKSLVNYAEWEEQAVRATTIEDKSKENQEAIDEIDDLTQEENYDRNKKIDNAQFHYNIQIHLPESRDPSVYDALFKSLRKHLL